MVTKDYKGLQGITGGYKWLHEDTRDYKRLKGVTKAYRRL